MKNSISSAVLVIGVVLLLVSLLWGFLVPSGAGWTEEKAGRLAELTQQAHNLMFEVNAAKTQPASRNAKKPAAEVEAEYKKVKDELDVLTAEFQGKRDSPKTASTILRWAGIAFVVAGGIIVFANREG
jgi:hypothetical protein